MGVFNKWRSRYNDALWLIHSTNPLPLSRKSYVKGQASTISAERDVVYRNRTYRGIVKAYSITLSLAILLCLLRLMLIAYLWV